MRITTLIEKSKNNIEIVFFFIIRIPLLLIPISYNESFINYIYSQFFFNGHLPYCDFSSELYYIEGFDFVFVPVFYYYYIWIIAVLSFNDMVVMSYVTKVIWVLFDFSVFFTLRKMVYEDRGITISKIVSFLYSVSPSSFLFAAALGTEESIILSSIFIGYYFFKKKRYGISAFIISIGFSLKLFPALLMIIIFAYLLQQKDIKHCILYILQILGMYLFLCVPYMLSCPDLLIQGHLNMVSRPSGINFFPPVINEIINQGLFERPSFPFSLSVRLIYTTTIFILILLRIFTIKIENNNIDYLCIFIFMLAPLAFLILNYRFLYFITPFSLLTISKPENLKMNKIISKMKRIYNANIIFGLLMLIYYYLRFSDIKSINQGSVQYQHYFIIFAIYLVVWFVSTHQMKLFNEGADVWYNIIIFSYGMSFIFASFTIIGYPYVIFNVLGVLFYLIGLIPALKHQLIFYRGQTLYKLSDYFKRSE